MSSFILKSTSPCAEVQKWNFSFTLEFVVRNQQTLQCKIITNPWQKSPKSRAMLIFGYYTTRSLSTNHSTGWSIAEHFMLTSNKRFSHSTGRPFTLLPTSHWHQKRLFLVYGPHTNSELLFWYQWEVGNNVNNHSVSISYTLLKSKFLIAMLTKRFPQPDEPTWRKNILSNSKKLTAKSVNTRVPSPQPISNGEGRKRP